MNTQSLRTPLNVAKIVFGAWVLPWQMKRQMARAIALPAMALLLFWSLHPLLQLNGMPLSISWWTHLLQSGALAWLAVQCHRVVLLTVVAEDPRPSWSGFEWKYLLWTFAVFVLAGLVMLITTMVTSSLLINLLNAPDQSNQAWWHLVQLMVKLPAAYVLGRSILVLPPIALGEKADFGGAWQRSKGNGWRLAFVIGFLPSLLTFVDNWLHAVMASPWTSSLLTPVSLLFVIVEVVAISLSHRELPASVEPQDQD